MTANEFDFEFTHQRRKFKGNLQVMNPFKQKMYRVFVPTNETKEVEGEFGSENLKVKSEKLLDQLF
jgi:hypothetical protein